MLIKIGDFEFTEVWDWSEKVYRLIESISVMASVRLSIFEMRARTLTDPPRSPSL